MDVIEVKSLSKRFNGKIAVDKVSFSVKKGEVFGLLGPNGAGKTTTLRMLVTLLSPTSGEASVAGHSIRRDQASVKHSIGYVPQLLSVEGYLTGYENMLIISKLTDVPSGEREKKIRRALKSVRLSNVANSLVKTYSGGMVRRLEIAQAMLHNPEVLFLDEPTVGLDPVVRKAVWDYVAQLRNKSDTTIVMTTHYMEEADALCDRIAIMSRGKIVAIGTPEELKKRAKKRNATLEDAFVAIVKERFESGGSFAETKRARQAAKRVG